MAEQIAPENCGPWSIHSGEHSGVRIDGPNGRAVLHVIQRDAHPTVGQGITQAESEAIAKRIVELWNASLAESWPEGAHFTDMDGRYFNEQGEPLPDGVSRLDSEVKRPQTPLVSGDSEANKEKG